MPFTRHRIPKVHIHAPSIHQPSSGWALALIAIVVGFFAGAGWKLYELGGSNAGYDRQKAAEVIEELQAQLNHASNERDHYRQRAISMERSVQIDRETARTLREEVKALQDERRQWREETEMVKKLLSDNTIDTVLGISTFDVSEAGETGKYKFEAAVTRMPDSDKAVKATLKYELIGVEAGEEKSYHSAEIDAEAKKGYELKFKHLERLNGDFVVPETFQVQKIRVTLSGKGDKIKDAEREFAWLAE